MECRLNDLDFPNDILGMLRCPDTLSEQDLGRLNGLAQDYWSKHNTLRYLIHLQGQSQTTVSPALVEADQIARYRFLACSSARAAWRRVPPEIWDIIFAFYLTESTRSRRSRRDFQIGERMAASAPYTLSSVCVAWREMVLSSPSVWTNWRLAVTRGANDWQPIPLTTERWTSHALPRLNRLASHGISWSFTLSISVVGKGSRGRCNCPLPVPVQEHDAFKLVDRVKISADIMSSTYLRDMEFPSASSVVFISNRRTVDPGPFYDLPRVPSAKKAVLFNILVLPFLPDTIPWANLTHLLIDQDFEKGHVVALLGLCTSIQHLCVCRANWFIRPPGLQWFETLSLTPSILPHLSSLTISNSGPAQRPLLPTADDLGNWEFPSLRTVRIFMRRTHADENVASFLRPFKRVTSLTLIVKAQDGRGAYHISSVLEYCPLLTDFTIAMESIGDMACLVCKDWRPRTWNLRRLAILCDPTPEVKRAPYTGYVRPFPVQGPFPVQDVYDLVASRRGKSLGPGMGQLDRLILRFMRNASDWDARPIVPSYYIQLKTDIEVTLRPFVLEGLELSVEVMMDKALFMSPFPNEKHWDDGVMDFVDDCWEYSTSMPPHNSS